MGQPGCVIGFNEVVKMGRTPQKIRTKAYVHIGDELVDVDTLNGEQRVKLATELKKTYLNTLFAGKAVFREAEDKAGE